MTDYEIKCLVLAAAQGRCPFCAADLTARSPLMIGVERGLVGKDLMTCAANGDARLRAEGIDPESFHRLDCDRPKPEPT